MPRDVFFAGQRAKSPKTSTTAKVERLIARLGMENFVKPGDLVAIKIHFGELGNDSFISPVFARKIADAVRAAGGRPFFTDTNTLYSGARSNGVQHCETAIAHGFDFAVCGAPVIIADGIKSGDWREVPIGRKWFQKVKIAGGILDADALIVVSHFKGHDQAGFGGAIKNLAMGCAPKAGKKDQHTLRFVIKPDKCTGCLTCASICPVSAIIKAEAAPLPLTLSGDTAVVPGDGEEGAAAASVPGAPAAMQRTAARPEIDTERCLGCGECQGRCPAHAISQTWDVDMTEFAERLAESAYGAVKDKKGKVFYLNFVRDVSPDCDCAPWSDAPIVADQGILASTDPVAIDAASRDLVNAAPVLPGSILDGRAAPGEDKFSLLHPATRGEAQLEHGEAIGLGKQKYRIINI